MLSSLFLCRLGQVFVLHALLLLKTSDAFVLVTPRNRVDALHRYSPPLLYPLEASSTPTTLSANNEQDLVAGIAAIDASNEELFGRLERLRDQPYFRFYSVDILASCEYMPQELFECYTDSCEIYPEEDEKVCTSCGQRCGLCVVWISQSALYHRYHRYLD